LWSFLSWNWEWNHVRCSVLELVSWFLLSVERELVVLNRMSWLSLGWLNSVDSTEWNKLGCWLFMWLHLTKNYWAFNVILIGLWCRIVFLRSPIHPAHSKDWVFVLLLAELNSFLLTTRLFIGVILWVKLNFFNI